MDFEKLSDCNRAGRRSKIEIAGSDRFFLRLLGIKREHLVASIQWRTQGFSMGGSVTSNRDDLKIQQLQYNSEVLKCIGL